MTLLMSFCVSAILAANMAVEAPIKVINKFVTKAYSIMGSF